MPKKDSARLVLVLAAALVVTIVAASAFVLATYPVPSTRSYSQAMSLSGGAPLQYQGVSYNQSLQMTVPARAGDTVSVTVRVVEPNNGYWAMVFVAGNLVPYALSADGLGVLRFPVGGLLCYGKSAGSECDLTVSMIYPTSQLAKCCTVGSGAGYNLTRLGSYDVTVTVQSSAPIL
jgi:hypothetical protein